MQRVEIMPTRNRHRRFDHLILRSQTGIDRETLSEVDQNSNFGLEPGKVGKPAFVGQFDQA